MAFACGKTVVKEQIDNLETCNFSDFSQVFCLFCSLFFFFSCSCRSWVVGGFRVVDVVDSCLREFVDCLVG